MIDVVIGPKAAEEIRAVHRWNEGQLQGLGDELLDELHHFFEAVGAMPDQHEVVAFDVRRGALVKFPYTVYYRVQDRRLIILGVICNKEVVLLNHKGHA
jgi:hypothetical protein